MLHCGGAGFYRNAYRGSLVQEWLPKLDGAVSKLQAGALFADVGCGHGHSTVIMAEAFPNSTFVGFDTHLDSVAEAHKIAKAAGVAGRAAFETARADDYAGKGYDLICFFDCLHDMGDPVAVAAQDRKSPRLNSSH